MATLTRYTAKFYKDSSKIFYAVFISASENPISSVKEASKSYSYTTASELLSDSSYKHVLTFANITTGSGTVFFNITFEDGTVITASGQIPTDKQILASPHDSLVFSTSFADFDPYSKTYSIADSIYYSKSPYKSLYIFPSSSAVHLMPPEEGLYYTTSGSAAYIASNGLQNAYLNSDEFAAAVEPYDWGDVLTDTGYDPDQWGEFAAGDGVQILNFAQYTDASKTGPVVYGYVYVNTTHIPKGGTTYNISKNRASSNYYLKGCSDFNLPCADDGSTFSNDCITGTALTAKILNDDDNIFKDGGCAATCEGFSLSVKNTRKPTTDISADGIIFAEVIGGTANYTFVLTVIKLDVSVTPPSPKTASAVTTDTKEFTSLHAGEYTLKVTDSSTSACILTQNVIINSENSAGTQKGCKQSGAVNYDSGIAADNEFDQLCVYCNRDSGLLIQGVDIDNRPQSLGSFASVKVQSLNNATSLSNTGASNDDGRVILSSLELLGYNLGFGGKLEKFNFNSGDYFSEGTDFEYKLYSRNTPPYDWGDVLNLTTAHVVANGTLVATQSNVSGSAMQFTALPPASYAVRISYTHDSATKEYEDCYIIKQFDILQEGCTNPSADNYNSGADIDDGTCYTIRSTCSLSDTAAVFSLTCESDSVFLNITLPTYDGSAGADGNALAIAANMTDPETGEQALGSDCFYRVNFLIHVPGSTAEMHHATQLMTFDNLCTPGGFTSNLGCDGSNLIHAEIKFTYGGEAQMSGGGAWDMSHSLNQGDCTYSQLYSLTPTDAIFDTCDGCAEPDGTVTGCTDIGACNYNPEATVSSGACDYTSCLVIGCTNPLASNYNPDALEDDGSCEFAVIGCMDPAADNYDPTATYSSGSCDYTYTPCQQLSDLFGPSFGGDSGTPNYPDSSYATSTDSPTEYNSVSGMCEETSPFGTLTVTLPNAEILANTEITQVYWVSGIINTWTGEMRFNFTDEIAFADVSLADISALVNQFFSINIAGDPIISSLSGGDLLHIDDSYEYSNVTAGNYITVSFLYTSEMLTMSGLAIQNPIAMCTAYAATAQVSLGSCSGQPQIVYGCADMAADNYDSSVTNDDGTCTYSSGGCTDVYSANYNSSAAFDDGSCIYTSLACSPPTPQTCAPNTYVDPTAESSDTLASCCIPQDISRRLTAIEECLTTSGSRFYNKLITGLSDTCSTMDAWKMVIILEILQHKGLPCVYNCSDENTPDLQNTTCAGVWADQGSNIWYSDNNYQVGHVVQSPVNAQYYVAITGVGLQEPPNTTASNTNNVISGWTRCCDEAVYSGNINYLTKFLSFVEKYCKDCEIPPYKQDTSPISPEVDSGFTVGGLSVKNQGSTLGDK